MIVADLPKTVEHDGRTYEFDLISRFGEVIYRWQGKDDEDEGQKVRHVVVIFE